MKITKKDIIESYNNLDKYLNQNKKERRSIMKELQDHMNNVLASKMFKDNPNNHE